MWLFFYFLFLIYVERKIGEIYLSKLLGAEIKVCEYKLKHRVGERCQECAYLDHCNNTGFFEYRRKEAGSCSKDSRSDKKVVYFKLKEQIYNIPESIQKKLARTFDLGTGERENEIDKLLDEQYKYEIEVIKQLDLGTEFFSKLTGSTLKVVEGNEIERCTKCAYFKPCMGEMWGLYRLRQIEAGHCTSKTRKDKKNVYFEVLEKKYEVSEEVYKMLINLEDSEDFEIEEVRKLQKYLIDSVYAENTHVE